MSTIHLVKAPTHLKRKKRPFRKYDVRVPIGIGRFLRYKRQELLTIEFLRKNAKFILAAVAEGNLTVFDPSGAPYTEQALRDLLGAAVSGFTASPASGPVALTGADTLEVDLEVSGDGFAAVEFVLDVGGSTQGFVIYPNESDPYGGAQDDFTDAGITVTYVDADKKWTIDFGSSLTADFANEDSISIYIGVLDSEGNYLFGDTGSPTQDNTITYEVTVS